MAVVNLPININLLDPFSLCPLHDSPSFHFKDNSVTAVLILFHTIFNIHRFFYIKINPEQTYIKSGHNLIFSLLKMTRFKKSDYSRKFSKLNL